MERKIYTQFKHYKSPKQLLSLLFNYTKCGRVPVTFVDEKLTIEDCSWKARRSFTDIYEILQTAFPDYSFVDFCTDFREYLDKEYMSILYCPDINKVVFRRIDTSKFLGRSMFAGWLRGMGEYSITEYDVKGCDGLSLEDIGLLLHIDIKQQIDDYVKKKDNTIIGRGTSHVRHPRRVRQRINRRISTWRQRFKVPFQGVLR